MDWDFDNNRPIYQQIVEHLERSIVGGEYAPGDKLPPVRELATDAGVNPNTMQRALAELEHKGLVIAQRTSGRYVTEDHGRIEKMRDEIARSHTADYLDAMNELGYKKSEILERIDSAVADDA